MRAALNWANLTTPLGLAIARAARCRVRPYAPGAARPAGLWVAEGFEGPLPRAAAFTVGSVVVLRPAVGAPEHRPDLMRHEAAHATQYALCGGLPFLPLYFAAAGWSWLRTGDPASRNVFERAAGLQRGGYCEAPPIPWRRRGRQLAAAARGTGRRSRSRPPR